jgi:trehalose 6-phosphate synthase/phosphatase
MSDAGRLVVVSNRLPVSLSASGAFRPSSGGLASALESVRSARAARGAAMAWVGWLGAESAAAEQPRVTAELAALGCAPVFLSAAHQRLFYDGASNAELWPRLHALESAPHSPAAFAAYREANFAFAAAAVAAAGAASGGGGAAAVFWVHDYHLMLVPAAIKALSPASKVAWFLHVPFLGGAQEELSPRRMSGRWARLGKCHPGLGGYLVAGVCVSRPWRMKSKSSP